MSEELAGDRDLSSRLEDLQKMLSSSSRKLDQCRKALEHVGNSMMRDAQRERIIRETLRDTES